MNYIELKLAERLKAIRENIDGRIIFTTSLGIEDQLLTHHIASQKLDIEIVTLDTGRLFNQSHALWQETEDKYGITIKGFYPDPEAISKWVRANGTNGFYNSVDARKNCCAIRKIEPLNRALSGADAWLTGLRADQSQSRATVQIIEQDEARKIFKINPLIDYSRDEVVKEIHKLGIPYNPLHDEGFVSIGCAPCTRAIEAGEDERAGRWWWEDSLSGKKECGLHVEDGKISKIKQIQEA
ncbi:phosphoadenylyl-sulfate reductase [Pseudaquidulcibacter saccharophilus]|uniref:phosphoadenylyl-sulfate reductase n=1 Tax=Pseudaquidulcibacter saccharophilus TaxID=2831900 RepID=UPI001EFF15AD|nr:phosphoadenylyl-sulfate reductase [Pseudaquidulcibacter saccharophilus]